MLASLLLAALQEGAPARAPAPGDRTLELRLALDDPALVEGRGPTVVVEHTAEFDGTLHVWTRSELALGIRVDEARGWTTLAEGSGTAGRSAYAHAEVSAGDPLVVLVSAEAGQAGPLTLELRAAPESEATREAVRAARGALGEAAELWAAERNAEARARLAAAVDALLACPGAPRSQEAYAAFEDLGMRAYRFGDSTTALLALRAAHAHLARVLPPDHADAAQALGNLAVALRDHGELEAARAAQESVVASHARTYPEDHPSLLGARLNLATILNRQGRVAEARSLLRGVLAVAEESLPEDHWIVTAARLNLAAVLEQARDLRGARELGEQVLAQLERTHPEDDREVLMARSNLAFTLFELGELDAARALQEAALDVYERRLPEEHESVLLLRANLALTLHELGDLRGARALQESVVTIRERLGPPDDPDLLLERINLANTLTRLGELERARELQATGLAAVERVLPPDHPDVLAARANLAGTLSRLGELESARELEESVLAAREASLPPGHLDVATARTNLALTLRRLGELERARTLQEAVLATRSRALPASHPDLLRARENLLLTLLASDERERARALVPDQLAGMRARLLSVLTLAPRQVREALGAEAAGRLRTVLHLTEDDPSLRVAVFELVETMRLVAVEAARALRSARDPRIEALLDEVRSVRTALGELAAVPPTADGAAARLTHLLRERDRLERRVSGLLAASGVATGAVQAEALGRVLGEHAAAVGYRRVPRWRNAPEDQDEDPDAEHLLAHVLRADGSLTRLDLGPAEGLERLALDWRAALGAPLLRGVAADAPAARAERELGAGLRARLLDPVLALLDGTCRRIHVCPDDLVFLVPLDALPLDEGRVGDRWELSSEISFARLLADRAPLDGAPGLLALGGVDYDLGTEGEPLAAARSGRIGIPGRFPGLLQTQLEIESVGHLFDRTFAAESVLLEGPAATEEALFRQAPGKRWVHLATHGWFAAPSFDALPSGAALTERVIGMAPMLLCGLALAGANQPPDPLGARPGLLTAEELCSLDLSSCELAVLSACETNVGVRRAGQGIQSLQAALHAAGARSSLTSLWRVDDAATRRLMERFYAALWQQGLPPAEALWRAKRTLRDEAAPVRDWAGWILFGAPGQGALARGESTDTDR